jgi:hypothetical protein
LLIVAAPVAAFQVGPSLVSRASSGRVLAPHRQQQLLQPLQAVAVPLDGPVISDQEQSKPVVLPRDVWVENLDYDAFRKDVNALGKELLADTGDKDVEHLNKVLSWRNLAAIIGISTMWVTPNPITIAALSTWTYASWTMGTYFACSFRSFRTLCMCR